MAVLEENLDHLFIFAVTWSLCCTTDYDGRLKFNALIRDLIKKHTKISYPESGLIYGYLFDQEQKQYISWQQTNKNFMIDPKLQYH